MAVPLSAANDPVARDMLRSIWEDLVAPRLQDGTCQQTHSKDPLCWHSELSSRWESPCEGLRTVSGGQGQPPAQPTASKMPGPSVLHPQRSEFRQQPG